MNRIFITGDVHGDAVGRLSNKNFATAKKLDRDDLVFIAGDFGSIWESVEDRREAYTLNFLNDRPFTTMIVGGNHENWTRLRALPMIEKFGVQLGEIRPNVFFVPNGTLIEYAGKKIFCMGGAMSTDRGGPDPWYPEEGISWWRDETPTQAEYDFGIDNLENVGNKVDIIITHTMPEGCILEFSIRNGFLAERRQDPTARFLTFVQDNIEYGEWFCGHFHINKMYYKGVQCLYDDIIEEGATDYFSHGRKHVNPLW